MTEWLGKRVSKGGRTGTVIQVLSAREKQLMVKMDDPRIREMRGKGVTLAEFWKVEDVKEI